MRFWLGGPRVLGMRTGISFGPEDLHRRQQGAALSGVRTFVYVITGDHALTKVGVSATPSARLAQLQTSSPYPLRIAGVAAYDRAYDVEAAAHELLKMYRLKGEWFGCSPELALAAVTAAAARIGASLYPRQAAAPTDRRLRTLLITSALAGASVAILVTIALLRI